ncbi:glycosyltransferase family 2 protein [Marinobacterium stanieri]|uniref:glycosyltransferase family 2 protein n=1 Tax=Marinobacterium stanieri TaxID=49186 RepID=UPI003A943233
MYSKDEIKVSVCVITYNQENHIAECLQSLVDQKIDFPFEIIVGEDCSTDRTRKIVEEFALKYPDLIVRNYHDENLGAVQNAITTYRMAKGKYICHMDGDDGALPDKLSRAALLLDNNPNCVMATHNVIVVSDKSEKICDNLKGFESGIYSMEDLIKNLPFFTNSAKMVRKFACIESLNLLHNNAVDVELHLLESRFGKIFHINSPLGFYREMVGVSSNKKSVNPLIVEGYIRLFESLKKGDLFKVNIKIDDLNKIYAMSILNFAYQSVFFGDYKSARKYTIDSFYIKFFSFKQLVVFILSCLGPFSRILVLARLKLKRLK